MGKSSSEALRFPVSQTFSRILQNPTVRYRFHKIPPLLRILCQAHPIRDLPFCFFKMHLDIFPATPGSSKWPFTFCLLHQNLFARLFPQSCHMLRLSLPTWCKNPNNDLWRLKIMKSIMTLKITQLCNFLQPLRCLPSREEYILSILFFP
jgi:hypothetical protein